MATTTVNNGIQNAGDVSINEITLLCSNGTQVDLAPFLVELNITEDIFSTSLYGNIMIADSIGLTENGPIVGEEYIRIDVNTPGMDTHIFKTFRVYSISDRTVILDDKSQVFTLHFCSPEVFIDTYAKIYKTFSGKTADVAANIYVDYLQMARNIIVDTKSNSFVDSTDESSLTMINDSDNQIKFTCPGWGAMKTLSWLASKTITPGTGAADCVFYESTQGFYFGSISQIMKTFNDNKKVAAEFYYSPNNIRKQEGSVAVNGVQYSVPNLTRAYTIMEDFRIIDSFNTLKSNQNGYYANQLLAVDLTHKSYQYNNFDYVQDFAKYPHMDTYPPFTTNQFRNPNMVTQVAYTTPGLFDGVANNVNERVAAIKQNRLALLAGLSNIKIEGTVPGRTDLEAGSVVYFGMPKMGPKDPSDATEAYDQYMSGLYMLSCIRHKINLQKHSMVCEFIKDSFDTKIH
jgi:hypothetical protein